MLQTVGREVAAHIKLQLAQVGPAIKNSVTPDREIPTLTLKEKPFRRLPQRQLEWAVHLAPTWSTNHGVGVL
jgi:hypothetical protein